MAPGKESVSAPHWIDAAVVLVRAEQRMDQPHHFQAVQTRFPVVAQAVLLCGLPKKRVMIPGGLVQR